ncbi:hypothetical protein GCM10012284_37510 [Mangrovihabitans endophyticus]|uniref:PQQ-like domain-containing protein n=1 Tax=Mangrovihabitans endophyticus TaxID=1751298 RepID=A0A8J3C0D3_9ACTN|nr:hypothetical protein GCM10012284_37510 [Mangrovihabitans endophyticus]
MWAVAFRGNVVYVGGSFTKVSFYGKTYTRKRLAAFDARTGAVLSWNPVADGTVRSLAVAGRAVYAAGDFSTVSGTRRDSVARLDAVTGRLTSFRHEFTGKATTLAIGNGRIYVGGKFSAVDGKKRGNLAAFRHSSGALDGSWRPRTNDRVKAVAVTRTRVYVGGGFRTVNGSGRQPRLAAVHPVSGRLITAFRPKAPAIVLDVEADARTVYTGTGGPGGRAVGYTNYGYVRWTHLFDGDVHNIAVLRGVTYAGGHFDRACTTTSTIKQLGCPKGYAKRIKLAALDTRGRLTGWNPQANGVHGVQVLSSDTRTRRVAAGGAFTRIGGARHERFALFG